MDKTIINTTSEKVIIFNKEPGSGINSEYEPSGTEPYVIKMVTGITDINGIEAQQISYDVQNVPEYKEDTVYIVPAFVKLILSFRHDLICPKDPVRDPDGKIVGYRAFDI